MRTPVTDRAEPASLPQTVIVDTFRAKKQAYISRKVMISRGFCVAGGAEERPLVPQTHFVLDTEHFPDVQIVVQEALRRDWYEASVWCRTSL